MAITRTRLSIQVPWLRGSDAPVTRDMPGAPGVAPTVEQQDPDSPGRRGPRRGPNGRFVRGSGMSDADPGSAATLASEPVAAAGLGSEPVVAEAAARIVAPADARVAQADSLVAPLADNGPFGTTLREADLAPVGDELAAPRPIRIVVVEDVPDVAERIRELLRWQPRFKVIRVISDGRRAVEEIRDLHPDVVLVDALLQGRTSGRAVVEGLRDSGSPVGIVAMTVRDQPVEGAMSRHADAVVTLPLGTYDLGRGIIDANTASIARDPSGGSRIIAVFSAKGGVGKTTIAYNLAVSLATAGLRTLLVDGSLQFGDVRRLLRADPTAPSICDLPTDCVRGSDLADTVVRDASGVEILLAPPRPELAELVNGRDLEQLLGVLRRAYQSIVIDTPANLSESTLAFLDASDLIINVMTAEAAALESARMIAATFAEVGYPPTKMRYLVNRFDAVGAVPASWVTRVIGRAPDYSVASDWQLVSSSNAEGVPFVLARPGAAASVHIRRVAEDVLAHAVAPEASVPVRRRPWNR